MRIITILLFPVCIALAGGTACADHMLVKYRSGNVQTLRLDEPSSKIESISYIDDKTSAAEPSLPQPSKGDDKGTEFGDPAAAPQKIVDTPKTTGRPARIEWAQPME